MNVRSLFSVLTGLVAHYGVAFGQVIDLWSGGLTAHSTSVHARVALPCDSVRLVVDDDPAWGSPLYSPYVAVDTTTGLWIALPSPILDAGTSYGYRIELDGTLDTAAAHTGHFNTPLVGTTSFSFVTGSCNGDPDHPVWQTMKSLDPLFFLGLGDLHYSDPTSDDPAQHRAAYEEVLAQTNAAAFFLQVPIVHVWDDHDFCGNESDSSTMGRLAARRAFRECVPHHPLARPGVTEPIDRAFTIGRVRFIISDLRSTKSDSAMMGATQQLWLRNELLFARDHDMIAAWISPLTWNSIGWPENWGSQPEERRALSDFLRTYHVRDLFILSGDAHMLAIDDGTNADFSTGGNDPHRYPILQAAALNRGGSYKGGTFSHGYYPNPDEAHGQFGRVRVEDDGSNVCITFEGWRTDSMSANASIIISYTFCRVPGAPDGVIHYPTGTDATAAWEPNGDLLFTMRDARGEGRVEVFDAVGSRVLERGLIWEDGHATAHARSLRAGVYTARLWVGAVDAAARFAVE